MMKKTITNLFVIWFNNIEYFCGDEQVYTHELEIKVSSLEEENKKLRRLKVKVPSLLVSML